MKNLVQRKKYEQTVLKTYVNNISRFARGDGISRFFFVPFSHKAIDWVTIAHPVWFIVTVTYWKRSPLIFTTIKLSRIFRMTFTDLSKCRVYTIPVLYTKKSCQELRDRRIERSPFFSSDHGFLIVKTQLTLFQIDFSLKFIFQIWCRFLFEERTELREVFRVLANTLKHVK